jgi:hypothetical protein
VPYRKLRRLFLPPGESDNLGSGIAKDTGYALLKLTRRKVIGIGESPLFSHARFISHLPVPLQAEYPLPERVSSRFIAQFHPLSWDLTHIFFHETYFGGLSVSVFSYYLFRWFCIDEREKSVT